MTTYLVKRALHSVLFVFVASLLVYTFLVLIMPGGPSDQYAEARRQGFYDPNDYPGRNVPYFNTQFKLDRPWPLNYFAWLFDPSDTVGTAYNSQNEKITVPKGINLQIGELSIRGSGILVGDFGEDLYSGSMTPVGELLSVRWGSSLTLLALAFALTVLVAIPLGVIGAARKGSLLDHGLTILSLGGISIPPYALGYFLILFLALGLKTLHDRSGWTWVPWLPSGGYGSQDVLDRLRYMVLPAMALAIPQIARVARHTRFALLDVLNQDYIRTARAKGLGLRGVIFKHALRNSLAPIIAQLALFVPLYMSAGIAVENVFAYPGLGKEFYRAVGGCIFSFSLNTTEPPPCPPGGFTLEMHYPMLLALLSIIIVLVALSNLIADTLHSIVDPRISHEGKRAAS